MNTNAKNNENKKYLFKEVNNPLFPISNKTPNSLNYYSALKLNINADFKKHKKLTSNDIISNFQHKKMIENSAMKNFKEINKEYSSSRIKEESQIIKLNNSKLSKIKPLDFSTNINDSGIIEKYKNNNNYQKKSLLSANKARNKSNINLERASTKIYQNNLNIISSKNLGNSQILNIKNRNNSNAFSVRKTNPNKNIFDINNSNNNSYFNNIIINNNSSNNINSNSNLNNKKK